jgi:hypothetical protein
MGLLLYGFDSLVTEIYFFMFDLRFNGLVGCQAIEWEIRWDEDFKWMTCIVKLG